MRARGRLRLLPLLLLLAAGLARAEDEPLRLSFPQYLAEVARSNLELLAQKKNLSIAEAQIAVARVFPDPQLLGGLYQVDVSGAGNPTASVLQVAVPLQIAGQRAARIEVASASKRAVEADVADFLRTVRGAAAGAYLDALQRRQALERKQKSLASLQRLVAVNEQRLRAGDIGEVTLLQSRVEAQQFRAEVLAAENEVRLADLTLLQALGQAAPPLLSRSLLLTGTLQLPERQFDVDALVRGALSRRPDLLSMQQRVQVADRQITLAQRNRVPDVTLGASWQHNLPVAGAAPLPGSDLLGATLTVPVPLSRVYRGEVQAAQATLEQTAAQSRSAAVRVEVEVRKALSHYQAAAARVRLYQGGVLSDADSVLERTLYNFQRGGATLVEVLVAQRTVNDVYLSYIDALADAARALVAVELAAGTWDLRL